MIDKIANTQATSWNFVSTASQWLNYVAQSIYDTFQGFITATKISSLIPDLSKGWSILRSKKNIAYCADGTWQSPEENTNVYKIFKLIHGGPNQLAFYDDGVGSDGKLIQQLAGGAMGVGLFDKIKTGYKTIAKNYKAGDDIFIFGFRQRVV